MGTIGDHGDFLRVVLFFRVCFATIEGRGRLYLSRKVMGLEGLVRDSEAGNK